MLTQKECLNELEKSKLLTCSVVNQKGLVEYSCDFEDTSVFKIFEVLIKEHFELVEKYTLNCEFISEQHRVITRTFSFLEKYINPQPYKFEDLKVGIWVWDDVEHEYRKILEAYVTDENDDVYVKGVPIVKHGLHKFSWSYSVFEEGRFFPVTKALEYQK